MVSPEPAAAMIEPALAEPVVASPEPEIAVAEPVVVAPAPEIIVAKPEAVEPEPVAAPKPEIEKPKAASEKPSIRRKSQVANGKLGDDLLPTSGMVVHGIGEVAKAIYTTPSPSATAPPFWPRLPHWPPPMRHGRKTKPIPSLIIADAAAKPKPQLRRVKPVDDPFAKLVSR